MPGRVNENPITERFIVRVSILDNQTQRIYAAQRLTDAEDYEWSHDDPFGGVDNALTAATREALDKLEHAAE